MCNSPPVIVTEVATRSPLLETENGINSEAVDFLARFNVTPEALKEALSGEAIVTVNGLEGFIPFNYKGISTKVLDQL